MNLRMLVTALLWSASLQSAQLLAANVDEFGAPMHDVESKGQLLYKQHCAACHDIGLARAPHPRMLGFLTTEVIHKTMNEGVMKTQAAQLTDEDKITVAEFLTQRKIASDDHQYEPPVCTAKASQFDWSQTSSAPNWGLTWGNTREVSNEVAAIMPSDVPNLYLKWAFEYPGAQRARSHPLIAGGAVFVGSQSGRVYALDAESGCVRWTFDAPAEVRTGIAFEEANTSTGKDRRLYFGDLLGRVYAVDAETGQELWRLRADDHAGTTITGTPTAFEGTLYVAVSSLEVVSASLDTYECCSFRGSVLALDAKSGDKIWQTFTVDVPSAQSVNAAGTQNYGPSGAPIWNSPAIDVKRRQLYVGTGENYSSPATLTSDAILAMGLETGDLRWSYQATPNDAWNAACVGRRTGANCPEENGPDFDFGAAAVLTSDSNGNDIVLGAQKSGVVHALNPDTGKLLWLTKVGRGGLHGGIHFGIAASGDSVFVPISDANDFRSYDEPARPGLYAIDLKSGKHVWKAPMENECRGREFCDAGIGAAITTTPSLVFAGALDGYLRVHSAQTGAVLRKIDTTAEVTTVSGARTAGGSMDGGTAPLPFNGSLFVNSGYNFAGHMAGNVLLVYGVKSQLIAK
jgi:polyvinyl alcohol dehydrogenase (cytochrome)